jgi:hypothetical protein
MRATVVSQGLNTPEGERAFMNFIRTNKRGVASVLGG